MELERWEFLTECKRVLCHKLTCSSCIMEDFCYYDEDVNVEGYVPDIEHRISQGKKRGGRDKAPSST